jgi:hypothetical protein
MVSIILDIYAGDVGKLEEIGRSGKASEGYSQDFQYCLHLAIEEFIRKYGKASEQETHYSKMKKSE